LSNWIIRSQNHISDVGTDRTAALARFRLPDAGNLDNSQGTV
jgi:hypothetical protein